MTKIKIKHQLLASYLLAEIEVFAEVSDDQLRGHDRQIKSMASLGVPFTPTDWIGKASPRRKMRIVRAARELEAVGLLHRLTEPLRNRTTHLIPTAILLLHTIERLGDAVDRDSVLDGLCRTAWGRPIAWELDNLLSQSPSQHNPVGSKA